MTEQQKLTLKMALLFLVIFVFFGVIIVKEKFEILFLPKVEKIFDAYIDKNYSNMNLKNGKITYKYDTFTLKLSSSKNKHLYFYLNYSKKKIKSTYQKDYVKGTTLLNYISKNIEENIYKKTKEKVKVSLPKNFNTLTPNLKQTLLTSTNYSSLKIYNLEKEFMINTWQKENIVKSILTYNKTLQENNIIPKTYTIILTDETDYKSLAISNLSTSQVNENTLPEVINAILNDDTSFLKEKQITYRYLNS